MGEVGSCSWWWLLLVGGCRWGVSLLSLIPHLIRAGCWRFAGVVWVWLGGTLLLLGSNERVPVCVAGGLAHCWVLRRHLLLWVFFSGRFWAGCLTHGLFCVVVVVGSGCGCVLSVA